MSPGLRIGLRIPCLTVDLVPERDGIKNTALESYQATADVVSTGITVKYAALDFLEFLENSGY